MAEQPNCARCGEQMKVGQQVGVDSDNRPVHAGDSVPCEPSTDYAVEQMDRLRRYLINTGAVSVAPEVQARINELPDVTVEVSGTMERLGLTDGELVTTTSTEAAAAKSCPFRRYCDCNYPTCNSTPKGESNAGS